MTVPGPSGEGGVRRRYALCGLSNRGLSMFALPLVGRAGDPGADMSGHGELVAVVDVDAGRVQGFNDRVGTAIPHYDPERFDAMVADTGPDVVLVTSPDYTHARYVVAALQHGIDVVVEKPMAASCAQVREILAAESASTASVRVAHNARYTPRNRQLKQLLLDGVIGRVTSVDLLWLVDTMHGSSYFRRWNRQREFSGGLSIHKSCHHLDMVNWLIDDVPSQVFGYGALNYYGPDSPHNPSKRDGVAYSPAEQRDRDPYFRRWYAGGAQPADDHLTPRSGWEGLGYAVQYPPDQPLSIYDEQIDIEDTYSAVVRYRSGASLSYAVAFSAPWEGNRLGINGTHGRLEAVSVRFRDDPADTPESRQILYYPMFGPRQAHDVPTGVGSHGGSDLLIRRDLLLGPAEESTRLRIAADSRQGAYPVAMGEALWRSVRDNRPYDIAELVPELRDDVALTSRSSRSSRS